MPHSQAIRIIFVVDFTFPVFIKDRTPEENQYPIFVALERGLNMSGIANIQPTVIELQI